MLKNPENQKKVSVQNTDEGFLGVSFMDMITTEALADSDNLSFFSFQWKTFADNLSLTLTLTGVLLHLKC